MKILKQILASLKKLIPESNSSAKNIRLFSKTTKNFNNHNQLLKTCNLKFQLWANNLLNSRISFKICKDSIRNRSRIWQEAKISKMTSLYLAKFPKWSSKKCQVTKAQTSRISSKSPLETWDFLSLTQSSSRNSSSISKSETKFNKEKNPASLSVRIS